MYSTNPRKVDGRYASTRIEEMAEFTCQLPDFCESRVVTVKAYIDEDAVGQHDIIFGRRLCSELGLILDYKAKTVIWNELSIPMRNKSSPQKIMNKLSDDPGDVDLPPFMKEATHRMTKGLQRNRYDKHNYRDMVVKCTHLDEKQQSIMLELFSKFKELFSGKLGRVPGPPVKLKLKKDA